MIEFEDYKPKTTVVVSNKRYQKLLLTILKLSPATLTINRTDYIEYPTGDRVMFVNPPVCCKLRGYSIDKLILVNYKLTDEEYNQVYPNIVAICGIIEELTI